MKTKNVKTQDKKKKEINAKELDKVAGGAVGSRGGFAVGGYSSGWL